MDNTKNPNMSNNNRSRSKNPRRDNKKKQRSNKIQRKAPTQAALPMDGSGLPVIGENWEWSGCDDNVNFGNRKYVYSHYLLLSVMSV